MKDSSHHDYQNESKYSLKQNSINIKKETFNFQSDDPKCSFTQEYPRIGYSKNPLAELRINQLILDAFRISEFKKTPEDKLCADDYSITDYKTHIYKNNILSISMENNFFGEGAGHGYTHTTTLNVKIATGAEFVPDSIFDKKRLQDLKREIFAKVKQLQTQQMSDFSLLTTSEEIKVNAFSFSDHGIIFYCITGDSFIQELSILVPYTKVKDYLMDGIL